MKLTTQIPAYLPSLEYFWYLMQADQAILTDHFQFTKRSQITRSAKLSSSIPILSIPVQHTSVTCLISEKLIVDDDHWKKKHFSNIYHLFHNEPFAYFYMPVIEATLNTKITFLSEYIKLLLERLTELLRFNIKIQLSSELGYKPDNFESIADWCKITSCNTYLYSDVVFKKNWLKKMDFTFSSLALTPFQPLPDAHILASNKDLSILSFLFQYGPEAGYILRQYLEK